MSEVSPALTDCGDRDLPRGSLHSVAGEQAATFRALRPRVMGQIMERGVAEVWRAPIAVFDLPRGFDETAWLPEMPDSVIAWILNGSDVMCEWGPRRGFKIAARRSFMTLQPKGAPNHYSCKGPIRFAQFLISPSLQRYVAVQLGQDGHLSALRDDLIDMTDAVLRRHLQEYALRSTMLPTRLEMESRAVLVVERLLTRYHAVSSKERPITVDWRLRRAIEYLEAHLEKDVGLAELAGVVRLTTTHLTTLFRVGTGDPPHRWLMRRRMERACELLANPTLSITQIATACGFASSQHLAAVFRKRLQMTPTAYRRERLS